MKSKILVLFTVLILVSQLLAGIPSVYSLALSPIPGDKPAAVRNTDDKGGKELLEEVRFAILGAIAQSDYGWGGGDFQWQLDNLQVSPDGIWAKAWIVAYDPEKDWVVSTEPGLAVARLVQGKWQVFLPDDPEWVTMMETAPAGLFALAEQEMWQDQPVGSIFDFSAESLAGYHLPWVQGSTVNLSRSVSHDDDYSSGKAHYAFDFYIHDTMWPIYAAKSGYVYTFRDDVPNDEHSEVNFLVLQNADDPDLYQLYLHLAQNSIPPELKTVGAQVIQGQYIATVDNTGTSTGDHLHFQVEIKPNWPDDNPYWNQSVDITFEEVDIYGGRPRREWETDEEFCGGLCEDGRGPYVSNNEPVGDLTPPYGDLSGVSTGDIITTSTINLSGWGADDDSGLDYGQLVANYEGDWHELGEPFNPSLDYTWDLCAENAVVPDGAVSVALRLYDQAGNWQPIAGLRHFTKDFSCPQPPPSCVPDDNQVTLFEGIDYTGGCARFNVGEYSSGSSLGVVGGDDAESIMVGSQVAATLFSDNSYLGHSETLEANDSYLTDNMIGANTLSSMIVSPASDLPLAPTLVSPTVGQVIEEGDVVPLSWRNGQGALEYQAIITHPLVTQQNALNAGWQNEPFLLVDSLTQGVYSWKVIGQNEAGVSPWSEILTFTVSVATPPPAQVSAPFSDDFESAQDQWTGSGQWTLLDGTGVDDSNAWWYRGTDGDYADGTANFGGLTSPPIDIGMGGFYLRFKYRYETENQHRWWDQRWVQISVDGGPFTNVYQLTEDPLIPELQLTTWLNSPAMDLSDYAGHVIRVRFMLTTLDTALNAFDGWGIDEFSITSPAPPACSDLRQDDTPEQATQMVYDPDQLIEGEICPGGDWDYYKFTGSQGDRIVVDIDANEDGSPLDPYLILYDSDGTSVLAEDDDEVLGERRDPLLGYTLLEDGVYYLRIRAWNHPSVGDDSYDYRIRLFTDSGEPSAAIAFPVSGQFLPDGAFYIQAQVSDATDRISRVDFYWHSANWLIAPWTSLGTDWDGEDGWRMVFDPAGQPEGVGAAVFVIAYDRAGNLAGAVSWDLGIDKTAPYTNISYIENMQSSNAFPLIWSGSDNLSGIDFYQLQQQVDDGTWFEIPGVFEEDQTQSWIVVSPGFVYGYRMRGVDHSGNTEEYPPTAEVTVTVPTTDVLCNTLDAYDTGGDDNTPAHGSPLNPGDGQLHNFCNPLEVDYQGDEDWASFEVQSGQRYLIEVFPQSDPTAVILRLFDSDGTTLIEEVQPDGYGQYTKLEWTSDRDGTVYLQMLHPNGQVIGSIVSYQVILREGYLIFMPFLHR